MNDPVRILQVISGLGSGGAEVFIMNMLRNIDRKKVIFDFLLQSDENIYKDELEAYGCRIYKIPPYYKHPLKNRNHLREFLFAHPEYRTIHVHSNALIYTAPLFLAKKVGIPKRIMHSHSTFTYRKIMLPVHYINRFRINNVVTTCLACSAAAGTWMFRRDYRIVKNAIDLEKFRFQKNERNKVRQELRISESQIVIGQVGRLESAKNALFSVKILKELLQYGKNMLLLFVGTGSRKTEILHLAHELGVEKQIRFLGVRQDVNLLLNSFDLFLLPSFFEGLSISLIEAQANGLPSFCSTGIPREAIVAENVRQLSLKTGPKEWARQILHEPLVRSDSIETLRSAGYDIQNEAMNLQRLYLSGM